MERTHSATHGSAALYTFEVTTEPRSLLAQYWRRRVTSIAERERASGRTRAGAWRCLLRTIACLMRGDEWKGLLRVRVGHCVQSRRVITPIAIFQASPRQFGKCVCTSGLGSRPDTSTATNVGLGACNSGKAHREKVTEDILPRVGPGCMEKLHAQF
jgi:hypothetical protein